MNGNRERLHIAFFGLCNAGKSSLVNAVTNQALSIVSDVKGTTTDPVRKSMELLPLGPVVIIDTPGFDDSGELGALRVERAKKILKETDTAVLVVDSKKGISESDNALISLFIQMKIPYLVAFNKSDLLSELKKAKENEIYLSAVTGYNIQEFKERLAQISQNSGEHRVLVEDLVKKGDLIILVTPIDESAPKGRLILPQQNTLRSILDCDCTAVVCKETELKNTLELLKRKPDLVITDSQVFRTVAEILPDDVKLTSFSILFARYKGNLKQLVNGANELKSLKDGDIILISEGCTHHRQCNDIGTVKLPNLIRKFTGKSLDFEFTSGRDFSQSLEKYSLVVHCGGCMLNEKEMSNRLEECEKANVPIVNYGVAIALMNGILERSIEVFSDGIKL